MANERWRSIALLPNGFKAAGRLDGDKLCGTIRRTQRLILAARPGNTVTALQQRVDAGERVELVSGA